MLSPNNHIETARAAIAGLGRFQLPANVLLSWDSAIAGGTAVKDPIEGNWVVPTTRAHLVASLIKDKRNKVKMLKEDGSDRSIVYWRGRCVSPWHLPDGFESEIICDALRFNPRIAQDITLADGSVLSGGVAAWNATNAGPLGTAIAGLPADVAAVQLTPSAAGEYRVGATGAATAFAVGEIFWMLGSDNIDQLQITTAAATPVTLGLQLLTGTVEQGQFHVTDANQNRMPETMAVAGDKFYGTFVEAG